MKVDSLSTLVKIKSMVKLANNSYHSLCSPGACNVSTASLILISILMHLIMELVFSLKRNIRIRLRNNNKKFIYMKQLQGRSGGGTT